MNPFSFDVSGTNISFPKNGMFLILAGFFVNLGTIMNLLGFAFFVGAWGFKGRVWNMNSYRHSNHYNSSYWCIVHAPSYK
jgi:hypothetical protein